jgi:hypothetical protein
VFPPGPLGIVKFNLIRVPRDRDHREQVHKRLASFPVVDKTCLDFRPLRDHVLQVEYDIIVHVSFYSRLHLAIRCLKKTTIPPQDLEPSIAGKTLKDIGAVDDWNVMLSYITHHKRTRHVNAMLICGFGRAATRISTPNMSNPLEEYALANLGSSGPPALVMGSPVVSPMILDLQRVLLLCLVVLRLTH